MLMSLPRAVGSYAIVVSHKQCVQSIVAKRRKQKASPQLEACSTMPANTAPRKVLPASPINNFAGRQFQNKKPMREPTRDHKVKGASIEKDIAPIAIAMQPATRPSRPSIKFVKLITAVIKITNKIGAKTKTAIRVS